jgi:DNA polymerase I-like protein with 3'-5' exonuclease and polymerase domains
MITKIFTDNDALSDYLAEQMIELIEELEKSEEFSFDTETTSPYPTQAELVGLSFCAKEGKAYYVPFKKEFLDEGESQAKPRRETLNSTKELNNILINMKKELLKQIADKAIEYEGKKELIRSILDELDKEQTYSNKHLESIAIIEDIKKEMQVIEEAHQELIKQAKG